MNENDPHPLPHPGVVAGPLLDGLIRHRRSLESETPPDCETAINRCFDRIDSLRDTIEIRGVEFPIKFESVLVHPDPALESLSSASWAFHRELVPVVQGTSVPAGCVLVRAVLLGHPDVLLSCQLPYSGPLFARNLDQKEDSDVQS